MATTKEKELWHSQWREARPSGKPQRKWTLSSGAAPPKSLALEHPLEIGKKPFPKNGYFPVTSANKDKHRREARAQALSQLASRVRTHRRHNSPDKAALLDALSASRRSRSTSKPVPPEDARKAFTAKQPLVTGRERERRLLEERHALLDCEDTGALSDAQAARLRQVAAQLDRLEDQDPVEQEADRRLARTGDKLDEILTLLRSLPRKGSENKDSENKVAEDAAR